MRLFGTVAIGIKEQFAGGGLIDEAVLGARRGAAGITLKRRAKCSARRLRQIEVRNRDGQFVDARCEISDPVAAGKLACQYELIRPALPAQNVATRAAVDQVIPRTAPKKVAPACTHKHISASPTADCVIAAAHRKMICLFRAHDGICGRSPDEIDFIRAGGPIGEPERLGGKCS